MSQRVGRVAPVIEVTEAVGDIVIVIPVHIQLSHLVVNILTNLHILAGRSATLVLVSWNINPERLQVGETVPGDQCLGSLPLYQLDTLVIVSWTQLAPVPAVVKIILTTARVSSNTLVADQTILQTSPEAGDD